MAKKGDKIWITFATSESCDEYGPYVLANKPTDEELKEFWKAHSSEFPYEDLDGELVEGPGNWGSWLYVELQECEIE